MTLMQMTLLHLSPGKPGGGGCFYLHDLDAEGA